ncbi:MAG: PIN domain-containing protein [Planctomycetales bacterium]
MPAATIDACCLIDLLTSGHAEAILAASGHTWHLPAAVQSEVLFIRQRDSAQPDKIIQIAADLSPLLNAGVLTLCQPGDQHELSLFTQYAAQFRSDGEAMCLALVESRRWLVATDDRKAIRIARQAGLAVISCPQLLKTWADCEQPDQETITQVLREIELLSQFRPNASMPEHQWWLDQLHQGSG